MVVEQEFLEILEDNYISPFKWNVAEQGQMHGVECIGGNCVKLAKIPNGIKVYCNSKNDFETAILLDDVNRGFKIVEMGLNTHKQFRNFYFWSVGIISEEETDPEIMLEISGNAAFLEYFISSPTNLGIVGKVDIIGKVEDVGTIEPPTPTPPDPDPDPDPEPDPEPETVWTPYTKIQPDKKLTIQTTSGAPLLLFSYTGEEIPNNYTLNNCQHIRLLPVWSNHIDAGKPDPLKIICMLPQYLALKWFPNNLTISQNTPNPSNITTIGKTKLSASGSINYMTSYGCGSLEQHVQYPTFYDMLVHLVEKLKITSDHDIKEIGDNLVMVTCSDKRDFWSFAQILNKMGNASLTNLTNGITLNFAGINYPRTFQYKNNVYGNTLNGASAAVATGLTYKIDDNEPIAIPDTPKDTVNLQPGIYHLWD